MRNHVMHVNMTRTESMVNRTGCFYAICAFYQVESFLRFIFYSTCVCKRYRLISGRLSQLTSDPPVALDLLSTFCIRVTYLT